MKGTDSFCRKKSLIHHLFPSAPTYNYDYNIPMNLLLSF